MSEELSRVKSRQKQYKGERPSVKVKKRNQPVDLQTPHSMPAQISTGTLSRKNRGSMYSSQESSEGEGGKKGAELTPSRSQTYTSERVRLSKIFVNSLIFMFVILLASLLWWGIEGAPPLKTLW
ncbi:hypothetical protein [Paenibacillus monticola]|uniref:Uncharacterized protein n=1 Tax=Paenibacillus monticola TaxID=2666075 RepID=A0A7X2H4J2_9BACL|nr:hypothetical protein [Paenibacillus monticola]MRN53412.1 hypothetical protein [Paenibacillus monticola]